MQGALSQPDGAIVPVHHRDGGPTHTHTHTHALVIGVTSAAGSDLVFIALPGFCRSNNNLSLQCSFASLLRSLPFYASPCAPTLSFPYFCVLFPVRGHACVQPGWIFLLGNFTSVTFGRSQRECVIISGSKRQKCPLPSFALFPRSGPSPLCITTFNPPTGVVAGSTPFCPSPDAGALPPSSHC